MIYQPWLSSEIIFIRVYVVNRFAFKITKDKHCNNIPGRVFRQKLRRLKSLYI